jgi:3-O-methylgallate 3,4-dioxygenase
MLILKPKQWEMRADFDRNLPRHPFRLGHYSFDELNELRGGREFAEQSELAVKTERYDRCQKQLDDLGETLLGLDLDALVIVGDDQEEMFFGDNQPAFAIYCGAEVVNTKFDPKVHDKAYGIAEVERVRHAPEDQHYPVASGLARHIVDCAVRDEFDIATSNANPVGNVGVRSIGHAYNFVVRRILKDHFIPIVPIMVNTYFAPNQPMPKRCLEFGKSLGRAIRSWNGNKRVAVLASGGLSHFAIDEEFDLRMLHAMRDGDDAAIRATPDGWFRSGTSEIKNWIAAYGAVSECGFEMDIRDYVPCYRTEAGTGTAMGFAAWS